MGKIINLLLLADQLNDKKRFETLLRRTFPCWETRVIWVKAIKDFIKLKSSRDIDIAFFKISKKINDVINVIADKTFYFPLILLINNKSTAQINNNILRCFENVISDSMLTDENFFSIIINIISNYQQKSAGAFLTDSLHDCYNKTKYTEQNDMLLDNIDTPIWYLRNNNKVCSVNKSLSVFLGRNKEELENKNLFGVFMKEEAKQIKTIADKSIFEQKRKHLQLWLTNGGQEKRFISISMAPVFDDNNHCIYIICSAIDLTEEKLAKLALDRSNRFLEASERLFKLNFNESSIGMFISDIEGNTIRINKALYNMLGYTEDELNKLKFEDIIYPDDKPMSRYIFQLLKSGQMKTINYEMRLVKKNDSCFWTNVNYTVARDNSNLPMFILAHIEDISKRKAAEEMVRESEEELKQNKVELEFNRLKTKFFANISHEFKTPLNLIFSSLHLLNSYVNKNEQIRKEKLQQYFKVIRQNSYRLLRLVHNLIDLTRMDADSFRITLEKCDIVKIGKRIANSVQDYIIKHGRKFTFETELDELFITCDSLNIERVILNLISNAIKFTEIGDEIILSIKKYVNDGVTIIVKDTGIGIEKEKYEFIFKKFRQIDESFRRNNEGSGIGLAIVKSLVEMHGGRITVNSEVGKGSEFVVEIPGVHWFNVNRRETKCQKDDNIYKNEDLMDKINIEFSDL